MSSATCGLRAKALTYGSSRTVGRSRGALRPMAVAWPRCSASPAPSQPASASMRPTARADNATMTASMPVTAVDTPVVQLTAASFQEFLETHSDKLAVIDFYAVWCGPCKMIAPQVERLATEWDSSKVVFGKLDCGADNDTKKLAMSLGIKALPTFQLYRGGKQVDTMTGAKVKILEDLIAKHASA